MSSGLGTARTVEDDRSAALSGGRSRSASAALRVERLIEPAGAEGEGLKHLASARGRQGAGRRRSRAALAVTALAARPHSASLAAVAFTCPYAPEGDVHTLRPQP